MDSAGAEKRPGAQEGIAVGQSQLTEVAGGHAQNSECPVMRDQCLVPAHEACQTQGEDKCPIRSTSEQKIQERLKLEEDRHKPEVEALEERGPRPMASTVRPSHGPKRKPVKLTPQASLFPSLTGPSHQALPRAERELPQGLSLQREEPENNQSEPSPTAKQHKKAKKRKSLGTPVLPVVASTVSAPSVTLGPERKAQRLRPLYQYINYCNPELNQAEGDREAEAEVEPESELTVVPEEAGVEQPQALLPVAGELGSDLTLPCPSMSVPPTHILVPLGEEASEEPGGLPSLGVSGCIKAEMDKSTQVDINKMLSVCNAPLVPPLSPQYK
ncbi:uncharacterized protein C16orf86 homolog [Bubalus bubalis]|uniref:uncharacterized protein C16orf86 homolog n=1 Tax=Bubalus bubalis TaxID=89462 RepID=UPI001E1B7C53|nr:uncharacterized protein C16orf86 homolog [Bubalus bubalis]